MVKSNLKECSLKYLLQELSPEQKTRLIRTLYETHTYFCWTSKHMHYVWGVKNSLFQDLPQKKWKQAIYLLLKHFHKKNRQVELALDTYHNELLILESNTRPTKKTFGMEYRGYVKPLLVSAHYVYYTVRAEELYKRRELVQIVDVFSSTLAHECEHGITDRMATIDRLEHTIFSEGIAELTGYFYQSNILFKYDEYRGRLADIFLHEEKGKVIDEPEYTVGFYLTLLLFIDHCNTLDARNPLADFSKTHLKKQKQLLKESKQLLRKYFGKEKLKELIISFRERQYKKSLNKAVNEMKRIEKKIRIATNVATKFL